MARTHTYEPLATSGEDAVFEEESPKSSRRFSHDPKTRKYFLDLLLWLHAFFLAAVAGFVAGVLSVRSGAISGVALSATLPDTTLRIPLSFIQREFTYDSPFSQEPPQGPESGESSEPIWDALIPNGLGYFKDPVLAPQVSIPTVFHQLHCLYTLRRAYYSDGDEVEDFDLGRNRTVHIAHCFDYLQQGLTCSADTTVEPAVDEEHGFLGAGLVRQCQDYDELRQFVEERRVFNASGFLAHGLDHGHVGVGSSLG